MYTYEIWVQSQQYHSKLPLTYTSTDKLLPGSVVKIDLRKKTVIGIVRREASAPKGVAMKPIEEVLFDGKFTLPHEILKLLNWMLLYYPAPSGIVTQLFLPPSWPTPNNNQSSNRLHPETRVKLPKLTSEQTTVLNKINTLSGSFLLHGETGSGKTRIYIELIKNTLSIGKSCMLLVPEIGLVPLLQSELQQVFDPTIIKVFHSSLTQLQRKQIWSNILISIQPLIIIGPRSALFVPLKNIGLVVVDECHDDGYKQSSSPYYHGLRVASRLAQLHNATLVIGSATPSITDVYIADKKQIPILRMKQIAKKQPKQNIKTIIISKQDKSEFTQSKLFSTSLVNEIKQQLKNNQQSLLFLNRRGSAKVVACSDCGWQALCPSCELPLTFHEDNFILRCHTCGYSTKISPFCPDCNNPEIVFYGPGTKAIEKEANKLFPHSKIARFDSDNLTDEKLHKNLSKIKNKEIDIIIGTQILVKGFDIPKLGLVGIIDADASLSFPDFSTEEKTYQLIRQAVGRVGRGHLPGVIVAQSTLPKNPLLLQALKKDWDNFYKTQLKQRRTHIFPPYTFLLKLECSRKRQQSAIEASHKLLTTINEKYPNITVLGPTPAFKEKQGNQYTWQLVAKSPRRSILLAIIEDLPSGWRYDIDPTQLL